MTAQLAMIAERWVQSLTTGDFTVLDGLRSPEMTAWHSVDDRWTGTEDGGGASAEIPELHDVRTFLTEKGFVLQAHFDTPAGRRMHLLQLLTVRDDEIVACEEYVAPQRA